MKRLTLFATLSCAAMIAGSVQFALSAAPAHGQAEASINSGASVVSPTAAAASTTGHSVAIGSGTKISAELVSCIDARGVEQGDQVVARVTKNVKQHGKVVVHKGDRLVGHITNVRHGVNGKGGSSLSVRFDQLVQGNSTTQLNAVITSIFSARGSGHTEGPQSMGMAPMPAPVAQPEASGGGLLGGIGSTVGSTVGPTVGITGSALRQTGGAVNATTQNTLGANSSLGLAPPMSHIHVGSSASARSSAGTNSILSTRKGNLRLASGTRMQFRVTADNSIQAQR